MRRYAAIAIALLALYSSAAPLVACVAPQRALTAQERECCRHMSQMCGSARMPQSHSCCKIKTGPANAMAVVSSHRGGSALPVLAAPLAVLSPRPATPRDRIALHHTPAESLPGSTILRI